MGTVFNLSTSASSTFLFKFSKQVGTLSKLLMSSLPSFKTRKSFLAAKLDLSTTVTYSNSF